MEKTKEQKLESISRFNLQKEKAEKLLISAESLYDYLKAVRYAYSLSIRYRSVNLKDLICLSGNPFLCNPYLDKLCDCGILKDWNDTYWFDKEKAERLEQFLLEEGLEVSKEYPKKIIQ